MFKYIQVFAAGLNQTEQTGAGPAGRPAPVRSVW